MYKIAVLGAYDSIYGFAALGLDTYPVKDEEQALKTFRQLAEDSYAVIYITEATAAQLLEEIEKYRKQFLPAIIQIPGITGNTGAGIEGIKKSVEKAIGSDILFGENVESR